MRRTDAIVGIIALAIGAYALQGALTLGYFYNQAPGPGFFPRFLALLLILLGAAQLVQAVVPRRRPATADEHGQGDGTAETAMGPPEWRNYVRVASVAAGWIVSVALIDTLGFLITMVLLVLYLNVVVDGKRGWRPVLAAIVIPGAIYVAFGRFLQIQLPAASFGF
jgi:hypothetical protein